MSYVKKVKNNIYRSYYNLILKIKLQNIFIFDNYLILFNLYRFRMIQNNVIKKLYKMK